MSGVQVLHDAFDQHYVNHFFIKMELDLQPGDVVKVLESAALGWVVQELSELSLVVELSYKVTKAENLLLEATKSG